ncbi:hypothetical protein BC826DRAFT_968709 [Russula brevipes]|nr:hypothetical protein BC826DRAFT_968709 [Russula brevipes]
MPREEVSVCWQPDVVVYPPRDANARGCWGCRSCVTAGVVVSTPHAFASEGVSPFKPSAQFTNRVCRQKRISPVVSSREVSRSSLRRVKGISGRVSVSGTAWWPDVGAYIPMREGVSGVAGGLVGTYAPTCACELGGDVAAGHCRREGNMPQLANESWGHDPTQTARARGGTEARTVDEVRVALSRPRRRRSRPEDVGQRRRKQQSGRRHQGTVRSPSDGAHRMRFVRAAVFSPWLGCAPGWERKVVGAGQEGILQGEWRGAWGETGGAEGWDAVSAMSARAWGATERRGKLVTAAPVDGNCDAGLSVCESVLQEEEDPRDQCGGPGRDSKSVMRVGFKEGPADQSGPGETKGIPQMARTGKARTQPGVVNRKGWGGRHVARRVKWHVARGINWRGRRQHRGLGIGRCAQGLWVGRRERASYGVLLQDEAGCKRAREGNGDDPCQHAALRRLVAQSVVDERPKMVAFLCCSASVEIASLKSEVWAKGTSHGSHLLPWQSAGRSGFADCGGIFTLMVPSSGGGAGGTLCPMSAYSADCQSWRA